MSLLRPGVIKQHIDQTKLNQTLPHKGAFWVCLLMDVFVFQYIGTWIW